MNIFFEMEHENIKIVFAEGQKMPQFENNVLTLQGYYGSYDRFQVVDLFLDREIVEIKVATCLNGSFTYQTSYYVKDYGVYNWRTSKDMSVIKLLEKVKKNAIPKLERHKIELNFGRTQNAKEACDLFRKKLLESFNVTTFESPIRIRPWNQEKEMLVEPKKTKITFFISTTLLQELISFIEKEKYTADNIKKMRTKAIFETIEAIEDYSKQFKKQKKKS